MDIQQVIMKIQPKISDNLTENDSEDSFERNKSFQGAHANYENDENRNAYNTINKRATTTTQMNDNLHWQ